MRVSENEFCQLTAAVVDVEKVKAGGRAVAVCEADLRISKSMLDYATISAPLFEAGLSRRESWTRGSFVLERPRHPDTYSSSFSVVRNRRIHDRPSCMCPKSPPLRRATAGRGCGVQRFDARRATRKNHPLRWTRRLSTG